MDAFEAVRTVVAVRDFQDKPVPPESKARILEAARLTGSASNRQPWHFIVVEGAENLKTLGALTKTGPYVTRAAFVVVVAIEQTAIAVSDGSRAIQSMVLTAWSEGIGSNWVGFGTNPELNKLLGIPDTLNVLAVVPFGYPTREIGQGKKNRKPAEEVIHYGKFHQP